MLREREEDILTLDEQDALVRHSRSRSQELKLIKALHSPGLTADISNLITTLIRRGLWRNKVPNMDVWVLKGHTSRIAPQCSL